MSLHRNYFIAFGVLSFAVLALLPFAVSADDSLWTSGELQFEIEGAAKDNHRFGLECGVENMIYTTMEGGIPVDKQADDTCLFATQHGQVERAGRFYRPPNASKGGQTRHAWHALPVPQQDRWYSLRNTSDFRSTRFITAYDSFQIKQLSYEYSYTVSSSSTRELQWDSGNGMEIYMNQLGVSSNGQWMLGRDIDGRVVRVNMDTFAADVIYKTPGGRTSPGGDFDMAISDDGRYAVISGKVYGSADPKTFIVDTSTCDLTGNNSKEVATNCGVREVTDAIQDFTGEVQKAEFPVFSPDNTLISMNLHTDDGEERVALLTSGRDYHSLDYLALGDSFTSGEGDHDASFYESGTNIPVSADLPEGEKCRISQRSYPYLFADGMSTREGRFKSVACSGAVMEDINNRENRGEHRYEGQFKQFENIGDGEPLINAKKEAIDSFTPGRAAQIEFVEKYKPKAVTIGIGGNDLGFVDIIKECASPPNVGICDYAKEDVTKRHEKAWEVYRLTEDLRDLYKEIHQASPKTKIYVAGYPKIFNDERQLCPTLNHRQEERYFFNQATSYANDIIETAAQQAGVGYIDLENALGDTGLCGYDEPRSVNGVKLGADIPVHERLTGLRMISASSYHPNHLGHQHMATYARDQIDNLLTHEYCEDGATSCPSDVETPSPPAYFTDEAQEKPRPTWRDRLTDAGQWVAEETTTIAKRHLAPDSLAEVELHSEPRSLGEFTVDETGRLDATVTLPDDVSAGYHTLKLYATLLSEEEVTFYQPILLLGPEGDRDNNDIPDQNQECLEAPVAAEDEEGSTVKPCELKLDEVPQNDDSNNPDPREPDDSDAPSIDIPAVTDQILAQLTRRIEDMSFFQRLDSTAQQRLLERVEARSTPHIHELLRTCHTDKSSTMSVAFVRIVLACRSVEESDLQIRMVLRVGPFSLPITTMRVEGDQME